MKEKQLRKTESDVIAFLDNALVAMEQGNARLVYTSLESVRVYVQSQSELKDISEGAA